MKRWLAVCATAIVLQGCGGQVQDTGPAAEHEADASVSQEGGTGGAPPVTLPSGCVLCNEDALCNHCLIQMSDKTWRCPVGAELPNAQCWSLGETHTAGNYTFTCYYC